MDMSVEIRSKKELELALSGLEDLKRPKEELEQYTTDSSVAARVIWTIYMLGDVKDKVIADLGTGNGVLAIGCSLLGAKHVYAVDIDADTIKVASENYRAISSSYATSKVDFLVTDVSEIEIWADVTVTNPPFGMRRKHSDVLFISKGVEISPRTYVIHQVESDRFYRALGGRLGCSVDLIDVFDFPIKMSMKHHTKRIYRFKAGLWRFVRERKAH